MDEAQQATESDAKHELPGMDELRRAVSKQKGPPAAHGRSLQEDAVAGLTCAIANVPDGMANARARGSEPSLRPLCHPGRPFDRRNAVEPRSHGYHDDDGRIADYGAGVRTTAG